MISLLTFYIIYMWNNIWGTRSQNILLKLISILCVFFYFLEVEPLGNLKLYVWLKILAHIIYIGQQYYRI